MSSDAPLFNDIALGPENGRAFWLRADDGVRLRMALWPEGGKGTVLMLPGRTEFIEKYGPVARKLAAWGYASAAIDWRGQGLADRQDASPMAGYVEEFADYQKDLQAVLAQLSALGQPGPYFLLGHSMGGGIGLRALLNGLDVRAAAFSAPMWGINFPPVVRQIACALAYFGVALGQGLRFAPGTGPQPYVLTSKFAGNKLTRDPEMFDWAQQSLRAHPGLGLGGASLRWLDRALRECRDMAACPSPGLPCVTFLGTSERVVSPQAIRDRMARWPGGKLVVLPDAEHEVLLEVPPTRERVFTEIRALFDNAS